MHISVREIVQATEERKDALIGFNGVCLIFGLEILKVPVEKDEARDAEFAV